MSRAFTPPDTLTKEDVKTIADVRRAIWTNGFKGLAVGSLAGYTAHTTARSLQSWSMSRAVRAAGEGARATELQYLLKGITFSKNTALLSFMACGAIGGFVFATAAGKSNVHNLHPIFEIGKQDRSTRYQELIKRAQQIEGEKEREKRRLQRHQSLHENLVHGQGLSDSHGGRWQKGNEVK